MSRPRNPTISQTSHWRISLAGRSTTSLAGPQASGLRNPQPSPGRATWLQTTRLSQEVDPVARPPAGTGHPGQLLAAAQPAAREQAAGERATGERTARNQ